MFFSFVGELRAAGLSASMKEHLTLLELDAEVTLNGPILPWGPMGWRFSAVRAG
jgi:hypothetical protein